MDSERKVMQRCEWEAMLHNRQRKHKSGFQLKLGPSLIFPETTRRPFVGKEAETSEIQNIQLKDNIGFVGRPYVTLQDADGRRLPAPIHISSYKPIEPITVQFLNRSKKQEPEHVEKKTTTTSLSRWFKAKQPSKTVTDSELRKKQKNQKDKARQEKDSSIHKKKSPKSSKSFESQPQTKQKKAVIATFFFGAKKAETPSKLELQSINTVRPVKITKLKRKHIEAKPTYASRKISTKKYKKHKHRESLSTRCSNACYRACCKFYCCITIIIIIAGVVIFAF